MSTAAKTTQVLYLTAAEVSARIRVSEPTLASWRTNGGGPPFFKFGGRVVYREDRLCEWENERMYTSNAERKSKP